MKRSYKLIGLILQWASENHDGKSRIFPCVIEPGYHEALPDDASMIEGYTNSEVECHLQIMVDSGILYAYTENPSCPRKNPYATHITGKGYDLLDEFLRWQS